MSTTADRVDAICCVCGNTRTVSRICATGSHNRKLKCGECGCQTVHALVLPPGVCDWREESNRTRADAATQEIEASAPGSMEAIEALGICVLWFNGPLWVDGLPRTCVYIPDHKLALVRNGLDETERSRVGRYLLRTVLGAEEGSR